MARTLRALIIASGNAGTSGQSFLHHVTGAGSGVAMSDYITDTWVFSSSGEPLPIAEQVNGQYASGTTFNLTFTFTEGVKAGLIHRTGNTILISSSASSGGGDDVTGSSSIDGTSAGSVSFTVISRFNPLAQIDDVNAWFDGYTFPTAPSDTDPHDVSWIAGTATGAGSGYEIRTIDLSYTVDAGGFNGTLDKQYQVNMADRAATTADFDIEWSEDAGASVWGTGDTYSWTQDHCGQDKTVHYRWQLNGGGWSSWTPSSFDDPRAEV